MPFRMCPPLVVMFCFFCSPCYVVMPPIYCQYCFWPSLFPLHMVASSTKVACCGVTRRKQQRPGIASNDNTPHVPTAEACRPNETRPYSNATHPRKRQNNPTNGHTPSRIKSTHTRLTYTKTRPHVMQHVHSYLLSTVYTYVFAYRTVMTAWLHGVCVSAC